MAEDPANGTTPAGSAPATTAAPPPVPLPAQPVPLQLTQARVPLDEAGEAFTVADPSGRLPIVVLPSQPFRIRNGFVIAGAVAIVVALVFDTDIVVRGGLIGVGVIAIFLGVFQSFIVPVPEGARALLLRGGRYQRTLGAGRHVVPPWIVVSHVVTMREIPFDALAGAVSTADNVRVDVDVLFTFTIDAPERFVFAISAPDFDQVCQASALDAIRMLVRGKRAGEILDLSAEDTTTLRTVIGEALAPYGVVVQRVVIIHVQPPLEFMASLESRRLASVRLDEQTEQHALEERLLADRESLGRQRVAHQRERIELEAANEALRLQNLESRLAAYPNAARRDIEEQRIEVARALAGNTRAMVQVGGNGDVADALIMHTLTDTPPATPIPTPTRAPRRTSK
ncbi:MAG TPA: SPFH domain-containing protein [Candidatus Limnocylindrales bacterium]|nr:SPFH domain-containing protein [Candidatus Limnocylindrales bacterium]